MIGIIRSDEPPACLPCSFVVIQLGRVLSGDDELFVHASPSGIGACAAFRLHHVAQIMIVESPTSTKAGNNLGGGMGCAILPFRGLMALSWFLRFH